MYKLAYTRVSVYKHFIHIQNDTYIHTWYLHTNMLSAYKHYTYIQTRCLHTNTGTYIGEVLETLVYRETSFYVNTQSVVISFWQLAISCTSAIGIQLCQQRIYWYGIQKSLSYTVFCSVMDLYLWKIVIDLNNMHQRKIYWHTILIYNSDIYTTLLGGVGGRFDRIGSPEYSEGSQIRPEWSRTDSS